MNGLTVIIPSRNTRNLFACVSSLELFDPGLNILVIDDGLSAESCMAEWDALGLLASQSRGRVRIREGEKPFVYAKNCNIGITAAGSDDVLLLNDDALLKTRRGFSLMHEALSLHPDIGIVSAACNQVGNPNQHLNAGAGMPGSSVVAGSRGMRLDPRMVCFVAALIPRSTLELVGLLDERYTDYGLDDDDYCLRVRRAGLKIGIFDGCEVDHGSLTSTFRAPGGLGEKGFQENLARFREKWGAGNMEL